MRIRMILLDGAMLAAFVGAAAIAVDAQTPIKQVPPILAESLAGRDSFDVYCAPCHGSGGRGDGPVAAALNTRPADLTALARRHDGVYPRDAVRGIIEGTRSAVPAHGSTQMPIWRPLFRAFESDARVRARIANLVTHIESLQAPTTLPQDAGSQLFRAHCAPCHGSTGRGDGPIAAQMRKTPPDLTRFTGRNGGVFRANGCAASSTAATCHRTEIARCRCGATCSASRAANRRRLLPARASTLSSATSRPSRSAGRSDVISARHKAQVAPDTRNPVGDAETRGKFHGNRKKTRKGTPWIHSRF